MTVAALAVGAGIVIGAVVASWWRWLDMTEDDSGAGDERD